MPMHLIETDECIICKNSGNQGSVCWRSHPHCRSWGGGLGIQQLLSGRGAEGMTADRRFKATAFSQILVAQPGAGQTMK